MYYKNYGHLCGLEPEPDILEQYIQGNNCWAKFRRRIRQHIMLSEKIMRSKINFNSIQDFHSERILHLRHCFVIHPLSCFRLQWNFFMIIIDILHLIYYPFATAFLFHHNINFPFDEYYNFTSTMDTIFYIDIIINLRTSFYDKKREINMGHLSMMRNYFPYILIDIASCLPCIWNPQALSTNEDDTMKYTWILTISLLKSIRTISLLKYLKYIINTLQGTNYCCLFVQIAVIIVIYIHWMSCIILVTGFMSTDLHVQSMPTRISWLTDHDLWNGTKSLIYTHSLFKTTCIFSSADTATIKYQTNPDIIVTCIIWTCSKTVHTLFVCVLILVQRSMSSSKAKYKEMILQLKQYMNHKQLSTHTQKRLVQYYEFKFQKTFFREQEILNTISGQLRQEILMLKCKEMVENVHIFKGLPQSLLMCFVSLLQMEIFLSSDVIIQSNTYGTSMYFISSGTVSVYSSSGKEIYHLEDGSYFGEIELVMPDKLRIASYIAIEPCELYRLERKDFIRAIKPYPELLQRMEYIAAERDQHISSLDEKHKEYLSQQKTNKRKRH